MASLSPPSCGRKSVLQRPLSDEQIRYAVEDVTHPLPLYQQMQAMLVEQGRLHWFSADMQLRSDYTPQDPHGYYRNVKKA